MMARWILLYLVAASAATFLSQGVTEATIAPRQAELIVTTSTHVRAPEEIPVLLRQHEAAVRQFLAQRWPEVEVSTTTSKTTIEDVPVDQVKFLFKHVKSEYRGWRPVGRRCWVVGKEKLYVVDLPYVRVGSSWKLDKGAVIIGFSLPRKSHTETEESHTEFGGSQPQTHTQRRVNSVEGTDLISVDRVPKRFNADQTPLANAPEPLERYEPSGTVGSGSEQPRWVERSRTFLPIGPFALHLLVDASGNMYIDQIHPWAQWRPYPIAGLGEELPRWGLVDLQDPDE